MYKNECPGLQNCGYWYLAQGELYPRCHCEEPVAPCEYEDDYDDDVVDEYTYDDLGPNWY